MLTNFKVPYFQPIISVIGIFKWLRDLMGRWSGSDLILARLIDIEDWDMSTDATIVRSYGDNLDEKRITEVNVILRNDNGDLRYQAVGQKDGLDSVTWDSNDIIVTRAVGGVFDTADFDDTSISRGVIKVWYTT